MSAYAKPAASAKAPVVEPQFQRVEVDRDLCPSLLRPPSGPYRVGPGDELDIEVAEDAKTRAVTRVMPDGMLYFDVAEGIHVEGKTIREISQILGESLADDYIEPVVTVNVANADSQRYWILGDVREPGTFPLKRPTTLIAAISQTSGLGARNDNGGEAEDTVDLERSILIRDRQLIPVDFEALIREGDMTQNVYIRPEDYIYLPSKTARSIYVLGAANNPGPVFYGNGATFLTSVAAAGGPRADAIVTRALVLRGSACEPEVCVVNLRRILRGEDPDLKLRGGDIIWLPESPWSNLKRYTESVMTTAAQAIAVQEGLGILGTSGGAGVTITAGGS